MLSKFINNIINFFYNKNLVFTLVIFSLLSIFIIGTSKIKINENIFSTLPKGNSFSKFSQLIDQGNLSNQIVFSLKVNDNDVEELEILTTSLADSLNIHAKSYLKDIVMVRPDIEKKVYHYFYNNFPKYIGDDYYQQIETKIQKDSITIALANSQRTLLSPGGFLFKDFILKDPINITGDFFNKLNEETNFSKINVENGYVFSENKEELLITAKTTFNLSNNKKNVALYHQLNDFKTNWNIHHPTHQVDYFGTFQIGAENSIQIKKDTFLTIILTLIIILFILFVFYRKLLIPLYFILPTVFGGLFALGMIGFLKPEISGISLATGAIVFGIILDFSFHFFTHLQHSKSITETINEVSTPLLTGAFTTIMAFGALLFTNSAVLQDFGLFAALSLIGAAFFTLTGLPIFIKVFHFDYSNVKGKNKDFVISIPNRFRKLFLGIVVILTIVFFYFSFDIQFDGDLDNLSFHRQNLKEKEKELVGINPEIEKKLYLFAEASSFKKANQINYLLFQKIQELQSDKKIFSSISISKFIIPDSIATYRLNLWNAFWKTHQSTTFNNLDVVSDSLGFNVQAFTPFKEWIASSTNNKRERDKGQGKGEMTQKNIINELGLADFINELDTHTTIISTVVVPKELLSEVQQKLTQIKGVSTFNKAEVAKDLLAVVKNDFNYIFIISSLLVFISLLIIYGRIELALFTFIPMVVSWIWILGIASIFDIKFNFVNIVIATFVFGLGDDYSIFVTDGLLTKYKFKKNTLGSYNTAIILSAITTMVGTGVLFFAKHPAIHSVALISVLGIFCILVISIVLQPFLFDIFIQNRIEKKKTPVTLVAFLVSVFEFSWFVFGCLVISILLPFIIILPISRKKKRFLLNILLSYASYSVMYSAFHVRKTIYHRELLDLTKPSIIIANHTSFLDILMLLSLNPKIIIMVKGWVYNSILFGPLVRYAGYIYVGENPTVDLKTIQDRINDGYSLAIFPEGSRSNNDEMKRFHKGAFFLAQELKLDITPIIIHGVSYVLPKSEYFVRHGYINLKILPRIKANDTSWGITFGERTKTISNYFKQEYVKFKDEIENSKTLFPRVFANYIYKGPVLEWYVRIKWKLEVNNFEHYNQLLKDKTNILDVGCGYGYLSYFLHYKDENRKILGIDYDEEKINIAANGFDKTENLVFKHEDITTYQFDKFDAILLNDVLHYFSKEKQQQLLEKCALSLTTNGIILIRDGITDLTEKHSKTELTEQLSTKIFSFNKKEENFHFFSSIDIRNFAHQHHLDFQMEQHSNKTSNVLFTLRKK